MAVGSQAASAHAYLKYSRDDEQEADQVGMNYLVAAGYSPRGLVEAFEDHAPAQMDAGRRRHPHLPLHPPGLDERMGYLRDRIKLLPKAVQDRKDTDAAFKRAQVLVRARYTDPKNAVAYFRKLGDKMTCLDKLGLAIALSRSLEDMSQAKSAFETALDCGGADPLILREAGRYYLKIRDFARAKTLLEAALRQNSKDIDANYEYGRMLAQEGNYKAAVAYLDQVRMRVPENAEIRSVYGQVLGQAGDYLPRLPEPRPTPPSTKTIPDTGQIPSRQGQGRGQNGRRSARAGPAGRNPQENAQNCGKKGSSECTIPCSYACPRAKICWPPWSPSAAKKASPRDT